jgi:hypothetical protein
MNENQIAELVAQCVEFKPVKAYRKTWTNNHKHIVEKRAAGVDVDNPVAVYWTAEWTICGMSDNAFVESLGGTQGGSFIKWQVDSKTKKGVAEQFHEEIVLELASQFYQYSYNDFIGNNAECFDLIIAKLQKFVSDKIQ